MGSSLIRSHTRGRTLVSLVATLSLLVAFGALPAGAVLTGSPSKFESNDGNMIVDTAGNNDWKTVAFTHQTDVVHSGSDDSFEPGSKQDSTCPNVTGHQNPPKDDFTDVALFTEVSASGDTYLYGATIRYAANGNASENVEFNQGTNGACPSSPTLFKRVAGDKLLTIDYLNGGTNVQFHVLTWVTSGACFVGSDSAPCWGATVLTLSGAGAEGLASQSAITAANNPINGQPLVAGQFAEFGVNLSTAGILPSGTCKGFASTTWESRSSGSSFVSSTKDITIVNQEIRNCGTVIIRKVTVPSPDPLDTSFGYTTNVVTNPATTTSPFSLKNGGSNTIENVKAGSYNVTEGDPSPNYTLTKIDCSASSLTHGSTVTTDTATRAASFTLKAEDTIDCTFTNTLQTGAIEILKNSTKTGKAVTKAGAEFCYATTTGCTSATKVVDNGTGDEDSTVGVVCVSGLAVGTYYVNETKAPPGYGSSSQKDQAAVASAGTNCTDKLPTGTGIATLTDPPLADIQVNFRDGGSGETALDAPLSCDSTTGTSDTTTASGWDKTLTVKGVQAGATVVTITCTIKIDP